MGAAPLVSSADSTKLSALNRLAESEGKQMTQELSHKDDHQRCAKTKRKSSTRPSYAFCKRKRATKDLIQMLLLDQCQRGMLLLFLQLNYPPNTCTKGNLSDRPIKRWELPVGLEGGHFVPRTASLAACRSLGL